MLTAGFRQLQSIAGTIGRRACRGTATTSKQSTIFSSRLISLRTTLASKWLDENGSFTRFMLFV